MKTERALLAERLLTQGCRLAEEGRYNEARRLFLRAARLGDTAAMVNLGNLYDEGLGGPRSLQRALSWYRRAAAKRNSSGAANVGAIYRREGAFRTALAWFKKAVRLGDLDDALLDVAGLYAGPLRNPRAARVAASRLVLTRDTVAPHSRAEARKLLALLRTKRRAR